MDTVVNGGWGTEYVFDFVEFGPGNSFPFANFRVRVVAQCEIPAQNGQSLLILIFAW